MLASSNVKLFHVSFNRNLEGILKPKLPAGYDPKLTPEFPEPTIPRICFSDSIEGCITAIYSNIAHLFEDRDYPHADMHVYMSTPGSSDLIVCPEILSGLRMVHDAHLTGEYWALKPTRVRKLNYKVRLYSPLETAPIKYYPFDDTTGKSKRYFPNRAELKIELI